MNSRERVAAAMRHEIPDRVPLMCQLALGHYFLNTPLRPHEIWFTSEGFAEALVMLQQRYRFDGILVNVPGRDPNWRADVAEITSDDDGEWVRWKSGDVTLLPWDDNAQHRPAHPETARPTFETFDPDRDFDRLDDWVMYTWGVYHTPVLRGKAPGLLLEPPDYFFRTLDLVREKAGPDVSLHGEVFSPFTHLMELFTYEDALMSLATDPEKAEAILDRLTEASIAWAVAQARHGVDAVLLSSAYAGGGFISPRMYRRFVLPYERRVTEAVHAQVPGVPIYTHTCGHIGDRLELMMETGTDGVDTLDPPPIGDTELADAKARIGGRMFIKGNMNSVALLQMPDVASVLDHARERLRDGMPGGGYILSTACSVSPKVEPEKLEALYGLVESEGRY
ncbi:MAG TPA: uroporphyrinogen decarboxylase family protein [Aggregatilinea sp.]|uniref:uroporphyrinogen decarboxylase family protein n=1 Tax=Aggregatilinea sp. TaxID=2806333 RepID=UPI002BA740A6|nr:uroporphyrinogen decarboxylase family protein [Aggregatilinea sp.]HML22866.1 uroporphyrinogen decarboxylase family protein [Aggregatilinea sp.]